VTENPYSSPQASIDLRPRTRRSKESGNENYFKTARAHLALGCLSALVAVTMALTFSRTAERSASPEMAGFVLATIVFLAIWHFLTWWGAKRRRGWARLLTIIYATLSLVAFPVGTIIGIYLIVIAWKKWEEPEYYEQISLEGWPGQPRGQ